jgi:hypothetical protein
VCGTGLLGGLVPADREVEVRKGLDRERDQCRDLHGQVHSGVGLGLRCRCDGLGLGLAQLDQGLHAGDSGSLSVSSATISAWPVLVT